MTAPLAHLHHFQNYWIILGFTEVRLWESMIKSAACLCLGIVALMHSRRKDHCLTRVFGWVAAAWIFQSINSIAVVISLYISPVPNVARAGVSIAGIFGAFGLWFLAVSSISYYHQTAYMLIELTKTQELVANAKMEPHRRVWGQFRGVAKHGTP